MLVFNQPNCNKRWKFVCPLNVSVLVGLCFKLTSLDFSGLSFVFLIVFLSFCAVCYSSQRRTLSVTWPLWKSQKSFHITYHFVLPVAYTHLKFFRVLTQKKRWKSFKQRVSIVRSSCKKTKKTTTAQNRRQNLGMKCFSKDLGQGNDGPHKQQGAKINSGAKNIWLWSWTTGKCFRGVNKLNQKE